MNLRRYRRVPITAIDQIRSALWNEDVTFPYSDRDAAILLEQYKIYAAMADQVSGRRSLTNAFFLTLNTAISAGIGTLVKEMLHTPTWLIVFPFFALTIECAAWFLLMRSYRQLNSAKYAVIGALEERLPASPYWRGEWNALGEGRDKTKYWPLTNLEQWVPLIFAATYVMTFIALAAE